MAWRHLSSVLWISVIDIIAWHCMALEKAGLEDFDISFNNGRVVL